MRKLRILLTCLMTVLALGTALAQNITVKGTVTDSATGEGVPFASIQVKGTMTGTATDGDGNYSIDVPKNATLIFSSIGYLNQEVAVEGRTVVNVILAPDTESLEELVVVAYGVAKKESVTGAISTVKSEDIAKRPVTNVSNVLEGTVTGVLALGGGDPGDGASIRIRGFGSPNGDNSPLYVIDGVPFGGNISDLNPNDIESLTVLKDATSAALYGNRASNGVILITTKRGKSDRVGISVNINQGFSNRAIPEYDRVNPQEFMQIFFTGYMNNLMSGSTQMSREKAIADVRNNISTYLGQYNIFNVATDQLYDANGVFNPSAQVRAGFDDLNWYDYVQRIGYRQDYNVSGSGASDKSNYYFSLGYLDEKGQTICSKFNRWTGRANITLTPKKWLKAGTNLSASWQNSDNRNGTGTSYVNPIYNASIMAPIYPVFLHDMSTGEYILDANGEKQYDGGGSYSRPQYLDRHAIWENYLNSDTTTRIVTNAQAFADIMFLKDFTFSIKGDVSLRTSKNRDYDNAIIGDGAGNNGRASRTDYLYTSYTFQQLLNWNHSFGDHNVEVLLGHENYLYNYEYQYAYKMDETFAGGVELVNFTTPTQSTGYQSGYTLESYLSRAKYNYMNKYFVEASFRRDGSSRFHPKNRWGNFWSVGATWNIGRENFMQDVKWVDDLRFRASYGQVGNDQSVGYYGYMALYTLSNKYANTIGAYKTQNEAPDLLWEAANSASVALEGRLFNRLNFTVEYFDKMTHDLLFDVPQPLSLGAISTSSVTAAITKNIGSVTNRGVELSIDADIVKTKDFTWNFGVNATWMKNKILKLPEATGTNYDGLQNAITNGTKLWAEGHGIYDYYMYIYEGVDQMTGLSLYKIDDKKYYVDPANKMGERWDEDTKTFVPFEKTEVPSDYGTVINGKEYVYNTTYAGKDWAGTSLPVVYGSFNTGIRWQNFSLSALFTYALGSKCVDYGYQTFMGVSTSPHAYHKDLLNSWSEAPAGMTETSADRINPNGIPKIDAYWSGHTNSTSTRFLVSGNYLLVKNINVSYNFPRRWVNAIGLGSISLSAAVDNLWAFTARKGLNPQQSFSGAVYNYNINTARVATIGLKVNF